MDINGLTHRRFEAQVARPSAPARVTAPQPPRPSVVESADDGSPQVAIETIVSESRDKVGSRSRIHVDESTDRLVVEILNSKNEVIRQIPPEDALKLAALFDQLTGIIFDQKV